MPGTTDRQQRRHVTQREAIVEVQKGMARLEERLRGQIRELHEEIRKLTVETSRSSWILKLVLMVLKRPWLGKRRRQAWGLLKTVIPKSMGKAQ